MRLWLALVAVSPLLGQNGPSTAVLRGQLLDRSGDGEKGEFAIRLDNSYVFRCFFDAKTHFEKDGAPAPLFRINAPDRLEVDADIDLEHFLCYARQVKVQSRQPSPLEQEALQRLKHPRFRSLADLMFPRGNLLYGGVVLRVTHGALVVHTRKEGNRTFLLRGDTDFFAYGLIGDPSTLTVNTRVFIRAGKNFLNQLEAYQVIWGDIVQPRAPSQ